MIYPREHLINTNINIFSKQLKGWQFLNKNLIKKNPSKKPKQKRKRLIDIKVRKRKPGRLGWQYQMNIYIFFFQLST